MYARYIAQLTQNSAAVVWVNCLVKFPVYCTPIQHILCGFWPNLG